MRVREALSTLNFKIGKPDDFQGRALNSIIPNRNIVHEFNTQMQQYANVTKGINDVFSFPLYVDTPVVEAPELALRSEAYYYMYVVSRGTIFPMDMRNQRDVYPIFRYNPIKGITNWLMPWNEGKKQYLGVFPMNNVTPSTTTLTSDVDKVDTTIPVVSTNGYINNNGRITIGNEKISFGYKDQTNFYNCIRGLEMTEAVNHLTSATVTENNVMLFYSRLPIPIVIQDKEFIDPEVLDRELEIIEEHLEGIIKLSAYNLLVKIDPERALIYKVDSTELYDQYRRDIKKGYYRGRTGVNTRNPYAMNESGVPFGPNFVGY